MHQGTSTSLRPLDPQREANWQQMTGFWRSRTPSHGPVPNAGCAAQSRMFTPRAALPNYIQITYSDGREGVARARNAIAGLSGTARNSTVALGGAGLCPED